MINFLDLNDTINFYDEVLSLFTFYVNEINLNYIQIKYEKVVLDFESQIKMLLDYLNLDFENSLNNFT